MLIQGHAMPLDTSPLHIITIQISDRDNLPYFCYLCKDVLFYYSFTLNIEAVSCDEMFVDCSDVLYDTNTTPLEFAQFLRQQIKVCVSIFFAYLFKKKFSEYVIIQFNCNLNLICFSFHQQNNFLKLLVTSQVNESILESCLRKLHI